MIEPKNPIQKIKLIRRALRMHFHAFCHDGEMWTFRVENVKGVSQYWTGKTIIAVIDEALEYVRHEIEAGAIQDPDERKPKEAAAK